MNQTTQLPSNSTNTNITKIKHNSSDLIQIKHYQQEKRPSFDFNNNYYPDNIDSQSNYSVKNRSQSFVVRETSEIKKAQNQYGKQQINEYIIVRRLGEGTFGKVKLAISQQTNQQVAIKVVSQQQMKSLTYITYNKEGRPQQKNMYDNFKQEIKIMKQVKHRNIIQLFEVIQDESYDKMYLIQDYAQNGQILYWNPDVNEFITNSCLGPITEPLLRHLLRQMIRGLAHLHQQNIIHRDIKPQNILLSVDCVVKIADFGLSTLIDEDDDEDINFKDGTYQFMAPEYFKGNIAQVQKKNDLVKVMKESDIWALGVTMYALLYKKLPFYDKNYQKLFQQIQKQKLKFPKYPKISSGLKSIIKNMLIKDPQKRITTNQIAENKWINEGYLCPLSEEIEQDIVDDIEMEVDNILENEKNTKAVFLKMWIDKQNGETKVQQDNSFQCLDQRLYIDKQQYDIETNHENLDTPNYNPESCDILEIYLDRHFVPNQSIIEKESEDQLKKLLNSSKLNQRQLEHLLKVSNRVRGKHHSESLKHLDDMPDSLTLKKQGNSKQLSSPQKLLTPPNQSQKTSKSHFNYYQEDQEELLQVESQDLLTNRDTIDRYVDDFNTGRMFDEDISEIIKYPKNYDFSQKNQDNFLLKPNHNTLNNTLNLQNNNNINRDIPNNLVKSDQILSNSKTLQQIYKSQNTARFQDSLFLSQNKNLQASNNKALQQSQQIINQNIQNITFSFAFPNMALDRSHQFTGNNSNRQQSVAQNNSSNNLMNNTSNFPSNNNSNLVQQNINVNINHNLNLSNQSNNLVTYNQSPLMRPNTPPGPNQKYNFKDMDLSSISYATYYCNKEKEENDH